MAEEVTPKILNQLYRQLVSVPHRQLDEPVRLFRSAIEAYPDFTARLCCWIIQNSTVRDLQQVAVITLMQFWSEEDDGEYLIPAYRQAGRIALLGTGVYMTDANDAYPGLRPYQIFRVLDHMRGSDRKSRRQALGAFIDYLRHLSVDTGRLDRVLALNRRIVSRLWTHFHISEAELPLAHELLFNRPEGSLMGAIRDVGAAKELADKLRLISESRMPFRIAQTLIPSGIPSKIALLDVMSPTEALNSRRWLESSGLLSIPEVKAAYLEKIADADRSVSRIEARLSAQGDDAEVAAVLERTKEKAARKSGEPIVGDVAILLDISSSMQGAVDAAPEIAARIVPLITWEYAIVTYNHLASFRDVEDTGNPHSDTKRALAGVRAHGGTSVAGALDLLLLTGFYPDKLVIVTDEDDASGAHAAEILGRLADEVGAEPQVVIVRVGDRTDFLSRALESHGIDHVAVDYLGDAASLDTLPDILGGKAHSVVDDIMATSIPRIAMRR